jgi:hypothetical protein
MNYTVEIHPGAMIYIPCFINIGSAIKNLMGGRIHRHTDSMEIPHAYFYFSK